MALGGGTLRKLTFGIGFGIDDRPITQANRKVDRFQNRVERSTNNLTVMENKARMAGRAMSTAFDRANKAISKGVAVLERYRMQLAIAAGMGAAAIGKMVFSAADANETMNKFNVVFGEVAKKTKNWADEYSSQIGRSKYATMDWLNSFQDVLVPMGLAREEAAGLSKEMVTLAADLGSFNNVPTAQAARAMQSALVGNHEAVRKLGIQLSANQLDLVAQKEGYEQNFRQLDNLTKMQLRFQEMIRQSSDAVGDATRTADEFNNQWLRFKGNLRDITTGMGFGFMPVFSRGLVLVNKFMDSLKESGKQKVASRIFGIAVAVTALGAAIGFASAAWSVIGGFFSISTFAIAGALVGLILIFEDLWIGLSGGNSVIVPLINKFLKFIGINKDLTGVLKDVWKGMKWLWQATKQLYKYFEPLIKSTFSGIIDIIRGSIKIIKSPFQMITGFIEGLITGDFSMFEKGLNNFYSGISDVFGGLEKFIAGAFNFIIKKWSNFIKWFQNIKIDPAAILNGISNWWKKVKTGLSEINWNKAFPDFLPMPELPNLISGIKNIYNKAKQWIKDKFNLGFPDISMPSMPNIKEKTEGLWNKTTNFVKGLNPFSLPELNFPDLPNPINKIRKWVGGIKTELENVDFGSALKSAINNAMNMLPSWMQGMAKKIMNFLPQSPAKEGPLSKLDKVGPGLVNTIGKGINKSKNTISDTMNDLWDLPNPFGGPRPAASMATTTGLASNGYSEGKKIFNRTNTTNNQYTRQTKRSQKRVDKIEVNIYESENAKQTGTEVRKEIEKYFDGEAASSVGDQ